MREFEPLKTLEEVTQFIDQHTLSFIYISRHNCNVCHALLPQVREVMESFSQIELGQVYVEDVEEIAGYFNIFTVPVLILFIEGKEMVREARIVHMEEFSRKLRKIVDSYLT